MTKNCKYIYLGKNCALPYTSGSQAVLHETTCAPNSSAGECHNEEQTKSIYFYEKSRNSMYPF
jgi:hypothetical protein